MPNESKRKYSVPMHTHAGAIAYLTGMLAIMASPVFRLEEHAYALLVAQFGGMLVGIPIGCLICDRVRKWQWPDERAISEEDKRDV